MPFPKKEYFTLQEVAARWRLSVADVQYHIIHEQLNVLAWIDIRQSCIDTLKRKVGDEAIYEVSGPLPYMGYANISAWEVRQILRNDGHEIKIFICSNRLEVHAIRENYDGYTVVPEDLVISLAERDRFERLHEFSYAEHDRLPSIFPEVCFPGRPSVMHKIRQHFSERRDQGLVLSSLQCEAEYLSDWATKNISDMPVPKPRSISKTLGQEYRLYKASVLSNIYHSDAAVR